MNVAFMGNVADAEMLSDAVWRACLMRIAVGRARDDAFSRGGRHGALCRGAFSIGANFHFL